MKQFFRNFAIDNEKRQLYEDIGTVQRIHLVGEHHSPRQTDLTC